MKETSKGKNDGVYGPRERGPAVQCELSAAELGLAAPVPTGGNLVGALRISNGWPIFSLAIKSTQAGVASLQRYIDQAGTIVIGAAVTANLTANTAATLNLTNDGVPFQAFKITVSNTGGTDATLSSVLGLLQSH